MSRSGTEDLPPARRIGCEKCGHISCVCHVLSSHREGCKFRLATTCAVPIECPHGFDVCAICDPCTCPYV